MKEQKRKQRGAEAIGRLNTRETPARLKWHYNISPRIFSASPRENTEFNRARNKLK